MSMHTTTGFRESQGFFLVYKYLIYHYLGSSSHPQNQKPKMIGKMSREVNLLRTDLPMLGRMLKPPRRKERPAKLSFQKYRRASLQMMAQLRRNRSKAAMISHRMAFRTFALDME